MKRRGFLTALLKAPLAAAGVAKAAENEVTQLGYGIEGPSPFSESVMERAEEELRRKFYKLAGPKRSRHEMSGLSIEHYPPHLRQPKSWGDAFRQSQYLKWREDFEKQWGYGIDHDTGHIKRMLKKFGVPL